MNNEYYGRFTMPDDEFNVNNVNNLRNASKNKSKYDEARNKDNSLRYMSVAYKYHNG